MVRGIAEGGRPEKGLRARLPILGRLALGRLEHARIQEPAAVELGECVFHLALADNVMPLRGEDVMMNAEGIEIRLDKRHHLLDCELPHLGQPCRAGRVLEARTVGLNKSMADRLQVVALVLPRAAGKVPGEFLLAHRLAEGLEVARIGRIGQLLDLLAGIVDVVLAHDAIAGKREERGERIAEHGTSRVRHRERARGIGRDVFHVHELALADLRAPVIASLLQKLGQRLLPEGSGEREIDESRPSHLYGRDHRVRQQALGQELADPAGRHLRLPCQHHGGIGRELAMPRLAWRVDRDAAEIEPGGSLPAPDSASSSP